VAETYGLELQISSFLTLGSGWSSSQLHASSPLSRRRYPEIHWTGGWLGSRPGLGKELWKVLEPARYEDRTVRSFSL